MISCIFYWCLLRPISELGSLYLSELILLNPACWLALDNLWAVVGTYLSVGPKCASSIVSMLTRLTFLNLGGHELSENMYVSI